MKRKNLIVVIVLIAIIIIAAIILINKIGENKEQQTNQIKKEEYTVESANGNKVNNSEALKKPRKELEYYVSNITLQRQDAQTIFKLNLENQGTTSIAGQLVDIVLIGKNGEEEARMALYIREIKAGDSIQTQATINNDFTNVYDFKLVKRTTT